MGAIESVVEQGARLSSRAEFFARTLACVRGEESPACGEACELDTARYVDAGRFAREGERVFGRFPLLVGHAQQLAEPGSCLAVDLPGRPLLLTRDESGVLHAFYNVCRHRGTRLLSADGPCRKRALVCPYHAWSYALDGRLKSVPQCEDGFPGLDFATRGLVELPLGEVHGLLFVGAGPGESLDLRAFLGGIVGHWDEWGLGSYHFLRQSAFPVAANWKAIYDAFCEAYHVQRLHRSTLSEFFLDNLSYAESCGEHMVSCVGRRALVEAIAQGTVGNDLAAQATFVYHLFPNVIVVFSPDYVNVMCLHPTAVDATRVEVMMMVREAPADERALAHWQRSYELIVGEVFAKEDFGIAAAAQGGIRCGANHTFLLGRFEWLVRRFHERVDAAIA